MSDQKPVGSGSFAVFFAVVFVIVLVLSFWPGFDFEDLPPQWILRAWLSFAALILGIWGVRRCISGDKKKGWEVGQDTINWVVSILGVTFVLMALLSDLSERRHSRAEQALAQAQKIVETFNAASLRGEKSVWVDGKRIEQPEYLNAKRLLGQN